MTDLPYRRKDVPTLWLNLLGILAEVAESQPGRLEEEAGYIGLGTLANAELRLGEVKNKEGALRILRNENPDLDLENLENNDPYDVAVSLLMILT